MKTTRMILAGTLRLGRGTATVMGLAVLLALTVGLASTALAGTGVGARLDLGKTNVVKNATTVLRGDGPSSGLGALFEVKRDGANFGPALRVENSSSHPIGGTGIEVKVPAGKPPIVVQPDAGTANFLSADELDGKDSSAFANGTNGKADDANNLDGKDSSAFASGTNGVANNANFLDGKDSTSFFSGKSYTVEKVVRGGGSSPTTFVKVDCDPGDMALSGGGDGGPLEGSVPLGSDSWAVTIFDDFNPSNIRGVVLCADFPPLR